VVVGCRSGEVSGAARSEPDAVGDIDAFTAKASAMLPFVAGYQASGRRDHPPPGMVSTVFREEGPDRAGAAGITGFGRDFAVRHDVTGLKVAEYFGDRTLERRELIVVRHVEKASRTRFMPTAACSQ